MAVHNKITHQLFTVEKIIGRNSCDYKADAYRAQMEFSRQRLLALCLYERDTARLADEVNQFFQSVCDEPTPLEPDRIPVVPEVTHDYTITIVEVEKHLSVTMVNKSPGLDNIPNWILRDLIPYISRPICSIFNTSM